jgi:hypothetical protein
VEDGDVRDQAERDEQTLDIAAAVLGSAAVWGLLVAGLAIVVSIVGTLDDRFGVVVPFVLVGYAATIVRRLSSARTR